MKPHSNETVAPAPNLITIAAALTLWGTSTLFSIELTPNLVTKMSTSL